MSLDDALQKQEDPEDDEPSEDYEEGETMDTETAPVPEDDDEEPEMDMKSLAALLEKNVQATAALNQRVDAIAEHIDKDEPHPDVTDDGVEQETVEGGSEDDPLDEDTMENEGVDDEPAEDTDATENVDDTTETTDALTEKSASGIVAKAREEAQKAAAETVRASSSRPWAYTEKGEYDPLGGIRGVIRKAVKEDREVAGKGSKGFKRMSRQDMVRSNRRIQKVIEPNNPLLGGEN